MEPSKKTRVKKETPLVERFYSDNADLYEAVFSSHGL